MSDVPTDTASVEAALSNAAEYCYTPSVLSLVVLARALLRERDALRKAAGHAIEPSHKDEFETHYLINSLREVVLHQGIGNWRLPEIKAAADRLESYFDSWLAVCPHEVEEARLQDEVNSLRRKMARVEAWCKLCDDSGIEINQSIARTVRAALAEEAPDA